MKKISILICFALTGLFALQSCEDMDDQVVPVNDFIWKGLNQFSLWQENKPDLADNRFKDQAELSAYLNNYNPGALFENLLYRTDGTGKRMDRFSVMVSDYRALENLLQGVAVSNGMEFGLVYRDAARTKYYGYVRYVLPDSDASSKGVKRGDIFYAVNGTELTPDNYAELLYGQSTYTLSMADHNGGGITPNGQTVTLTKTQYAENPIYEANTYTTGSHKIGYLMYNGFYSSYDAQLNAVFAQFASEGVTDLVLDLRYNGGGSVNTASCLASMITGQFNGQLFAHEQWNKKMQAFYEDKNPGSLNVNFPANINTGGAINSLNLTKVYIIATGATASASELVINCLKSYIDVTVIGTTTYGKNVASVTLYDSFDFSSKGKNTAHRYAMQPIVLKTTNKDGFGDYTEGIDPQVPMTEFYNNLSTLGNPEERLYKAAIQLITNSAGRRATDYGAEAIESGYDSKSIRPFGKDMYIENLPNVPLQ